MKAYRVPPEADPGRRGVHFFHHEADDAPVARRHEDGGGDGTATVYELHDTLAHAWERLPVAAEHAAERNRYVRNDAGLVGVTVSVADGYGLDRSYAPSAAEYLPPPAAVDADYALVFDLARPLRSLHLPAGRAVPHCVTVAVPRSREAYLRMEKPALGAAGGGADSDDVARVEAVLDTKAHGPGTYLLYPAPHAVLSLDVGADHAVVGGHLQLLTANGPGHGRQSWSGAAQLIGQSLPTLRSNARTILDVMRRKLDAAELALAQKTPAGTAQAKEHIEAAERAATRYKKNAKKYDALRKSQQKAADKRSRKQKLLDKIRRIKRDGAARKLPKLDDAEFDTLRKRLRNVKKEAAADAKSVKQAEKAKKEKEKEAERAKKQAEKEEKAKAKLAAAQEKAAKAKEKDAAKLARAKEKAAAQAEKDAKKQAEAERKAREAARKGEREGLKDAAKARREQLAAQRRAAKEAREAAAAQRRTTAESAKAAREAARAAAAATAPALPDTGLAPGQPARSVPPPEDMPPPPPPAPPLPEEAAAATATATAGAAAAGDTRVLEFAADPDDPEAALTAVLDARAQGALLRVRTQFGR